MKFIRHEAAAPIVLVLFMAAILLNSSGRLNWLEAWVAIAIVSANQLFIYCVVRPKNPGLIERRKTAQWDQLLYPLVSLYLPVCAWIVAGLDNRFGYD